MLTASSGNMGTLLAVIYPCPETTSLTVRQIPNKNNIGGNSGNTSTTLHGNNKKVHIKECSFSTQSNPRVKGTHCTSKCTRLNTNGSRRESVHSYVGAGKGGSTPCYNNMFVMDLDKQKKKVQKLNHK